MNALLCCLLPLALTAQPQPRDGQHDFDFQLGHWKVRIKRLKAPLHGSTEWTEFTADSTVRPVWDGKAQLEELVADLPSGRLEGVALRLYSPEARQWSVYWANQRIGRFEPPAVGEFREGRGELYGQDTYEGRTILVRQLWTGVQTPTPRFEQAFSADGGKTWETNWIAEQTRVDSTATAAAPPASSPAEPSAAPGDGQHDFDFELGHFTMRIRRLKAPLHGSKEWYEFAADSVTQPLLGGKANLEQLKGQMPSGSLQGLTLRLYSPEAHQWRLYWANQRSGRLDPPTVGEFKDGRGEFFAQDELEGRSILVRYIWSNTRTRSPHFEQSFSTDGGKTWEANWITDQTRVEPQANP